MMKNKVFATLESLASQRKCTLYEAALQECHRHYVERGNNREQIIEEFATLSQDQVFHIYEIIYEQDHHDQ